MIQTFTGTTRADARTLVRVGSMVAEAECGSASEGSASESAAGWHAPIARAVANGELSVAAADALAQGLGVVDDVITTELLRDAAEALIAGAAGSNPDQLFRDARRIREELDSAKVALREKEQRELRFLRTFRRVDGMIGGSFLLDPEDGGFLTAALDAMTSPRRGGPRFVDPIAAEFAKKLLDDPRTNEQINADTLIDLVRVAVNADPNIFPGHSQPAVRVIVHHAALEAGGGAGREEATGDAVSIETVQRHVCNGGTVAVGFDDDGQCVNVGRDQRLFNRRQRIGMAVRDGGCRFPGCDRPPAWCEAHHINHWYRDAGRTDVADGLLLCRRHHLLTHNNGWEITREGGNYFAIPPASIDPSQTPREMPGRNATIEPVHARGLVLG
jgi:hypothetical protein